MIGDRDHLIRRRAYELWERAGRTGSPEEHWLAAEREVDARQRRSHEGAEAWAERLRGFYKALPTEPVPGRHWDLVLQLEIGPEDAFKTLLAGSDAEPAPQP